MTTYTTITNALVAVGAKPFATTIQALRDNPLAIAEADATVPAGLLPTVLLGTLTTTSGTVQTLSGLVLTPYKGIIYELINPDISVTSSSITLSGGPVFTAGTGANAIYGVIYCYFGGAYFGSAGPTSKTGSFTVTSSSTSVSATAGGGTFAGGSIRVYGFK